MSALARSLSEYPPTVVFYEDEDMRIETALTLTETVVFSSSYSDQEAQAKKFGYPFLLNEGFSVVYFIAKKNHWWQLPYLSSIMNQVLSISSVYRRRIAYGSSMGGYAALLLARDLRATSVVAIAPQTVLTNPAIRLRPEWEAALADFPILRDDINETIGDIEDVRIVFDPSESRDAAFANHLEHHASVKLFKLPYASHKILFFLREIGLLNAASLLLLATDSTPQDLRSLTRPLRGKSSLFLQKLSLACKHRRHPTWYKKLHALIAVRKNAEAKPGPISV